MAAYSAGQLVFCTTFSFGCGFCALCQLFTLPVTTCNVLFSFRDSFFLFCGGTGV
jgi:hypothetical protein